MAKLTAGERRLLENPPTEKTWLCAAKVTWRDSGRCETANSGKDAQCWLCRHKKPPKPKLLWPSYLAACKKANHTPGERYRPAPIIDAPKPKRATRKKGA